MLGTNVPMVMLAFRLDSDGIIGVGPTQAWFALGSSNLVCLCGAVLMASQMNSTHLRTFYMYLPLKRYLTEMWETPRLGRLEEAG